MDPMDALDAVVSQLRSWGHNFHRNLFGMWDGMTINRYVRMVAVVGVYFLLRPLLVKIGERIQERQLDKITASSAKEAAPQAKITPNQLRGGAGKVEEQVVVTGVEGGKNAKRRQKKAEGEAVEAGAEMDIRDHLVDYVEGEDGW